MIRNIVILNDYACVQGGAAQVAVNSAVGLADKGYSVIFIYASGEEDKRLQSPNIKCINLKQYDLLGNPSKLDAAKNGLWNKEVQHRISSILDKYHVDDTIVHIHSWVKSLSISAVAAVARSGLPSVLTLHDYFSICPNGGLYDYQKGHICQKKPMSIDCISTNCDARSYGQKLWRCSRQLAYFFADFPSCITNFISISDLSENMIKPGLSTKSRFWRITNPIDIEHTPAAQPSKSKTYTFIGRLSPEKGVMLMSQLEHIPNSQFRFIGSGDLEQKLKALLPGAQFLGWRNKSEIIQQLDDTRALLFTSQWYEGQGLVVAEAAARGVPAIVSDVTAARDSIRNGISGLLFESGNPASLEQQLLKIQNDDSFVNELGLNAYNDFWRDAPTLESHVSQLIACYENILVNHQNQLISEI